MATTADKRAWLRAEGYDPPVKGSLGADLNAAYDAAHPSPNGDALGPDYDGGVSDDDFAAAVADEPVFPPADTGETRPRRPSSRAASAKGGRWPWSKGRAAKPKHKRVPVDEVISGVWRMLARIAQPVPPLQRTLRVQAPVAGLLLEDTVKGTVIDTVLQPIARWQEQSKTVAALLGPPMLVTALTLHLQRAALAGTEPSVVFITFATEALRESLVLWVEVAGPKFEEALAKERKFEEKYGDIDGFIEWLMSPPVNPADEDAAKAEDEAIRRAQGIL